MSCDHKFVDSRHCLKCGWAPDDRDRKPAPSAEASWCFGGVMVRLEAIRYVLAEAGLAIVPAADVPTPEERQVLEACAAAEVVMLSNGWRMLDGNSNRSVVEAELARRATKEKTDG